MTITYPKETLASETVDDLTRIKGIGRVVENHLNQAGIYSFAQLSVLTPKRVSKLLSGMIGMTPENIKEQDWIGQAKRLTPKIPDDATPIQVNMDNHQHYETFSVKLLEDMNNRVRRTNIVHVQNGMEQNWAGWDGNRLLAFIMENAKLNVLSGEVLPASNTDVDHTLAPASKEEARTTAMRGRQHDGRTLTINKVAVFQSGSQTTSGILPSDLDWSIRLEWTLYSPGSLFGNWLVKIYLESMGPGVEYLLPSEGGIRLDLVSGLVKSPNLYTYSTEMEFRAGEVEPGIYWLIASISWEKHPGRPGNLMQISEKSMLQFYKRK